MAANRAPFAAACRATLPIRWNADGSVLYVLVLAGQTMQVFAINPAKATRSPLMEVTPRDWVGAGGIQRLLLSEDAKSYAFFCT